MKSRKLTMMVMFTLLMFASSDQLFAQESSESNSPEQESTERQQEDESDQTIDELLDDQDEVEDLMDEEEDPDPEDSSESDELEVNSYLRPIQSVTATASSQSGLDNGNRPKAIAPPAMGTMSANMGGTIYWQQPDTCHNRLYFEDRPLERYGQQHPQFKQYVKSAGLFLKDATLLPARRLKTPRHQTYYESTQPRYSDPWLSGR